MKVIYVAGPYRAASAWQVELNVRVAEETSLGLWRAGLTPVCPHTMTRFFQGAAPDRAFVDGTMELMRRSDAVLVLKGWIDSEGTRAEIIEARRIGKPVFYKLSELLLWAGLEGAAA